MRQDNMAIKVKDLTKEFDISESGKGFSGKLKALFHRKRKTVTAVDSIDFEIRRGEFVGYVGENGAGKSTTIKMLTGILVPTSGSAEVNGIIPYKDRKKNAAKIGVVFGQRTQLWWDLPVRESFQRTQLWWDLPVRESFDLLRVIFRVSQTDFNSQIRKLDKVLGLDSLMDMPVRKLSLGQRMRCDIAASLIHNPPVLFLDEPTIGLDVLAKESYDWS